MTQIELYRKAEIEAIELTESELKAAILEGKIKKWFHVNSLVYWEHAEAQPKTGHVRFK